MLVCSSWFLLKWSALLLVLRTWQILSPNESIVTGRPAILQESNHHFASPILATCLPLFAHCLPMRRRRVYVRIANSLGITPVWMRFCGCTCCSPCWRFFSNPIVLSIFSTNRCLEGVLACCAYAGYARKHVCTYINTICMQHSQSSCEYGCLNALWGPCQLQAAGSFCHGSDLMRRHQLRISLLAGGFWKPLRKS